METFLRSLGDICEENELLDFCRKHVLHGTPKVFENRENEYYEFRKRLADKFDIEFHEVFITGSAKLGFSPYKQKVFDLESDIDVALVSNALYERIAESIASYQMELRQSRKAVTDREIARYHLFLEYGAIGWMRPDLLPYSFRMGEFKNEWFNFFKSISHGRSEVGNYKVSGGAFKSYKHLEKYSMSSLRSLKASLEVGVK